MMRILGPNPGVHQEDTVMRTHPITERPRGQALGDWELQPLSCFLAWVQCISQSSKVMVPVWLSGGLRSLSTAVLRGLPFFSPGRLLSYLSFFSTQSRPWNKCLVRSLAALLHCRTVMSTPVVILLVHWRTEWGSYVAHTSSLLLLVLRTPTTKSHHPPSMNSVASQCAATKYPGRSLSVPRTAFSPTLIKIA